MKNKPLVMIWTVSFILLLIKMGLLSYAEHHTEQIERIYSRSIYPFIANILTNLSNQYKISIGELGIGILLVMMIVIMAWVIFLLIKKQLRGVLHIISILILCLMLLMNYLDLSWLLNNYRIDSMTNMGLSIGQITNQDLEATYQEVIYKTNALRQTLSEDINGYPNELNIDEILHTTYKGYSGLNEQYNFIDDGQVVVKGLITSPIQTMSGYTGIYLFFVGEPTINIDAPVFTLPHTAAHEIAHQKGFAFEGDANYIGFLACKNHPSDFVKYSGYLAALEYLSSEMYKKDPDRYKELLSLYDLKVKHDLMYIDAFWRQSIDEAATEVVNKMNDSYLKSYNQPEGLQSYDQFVKLLVADYLMDSEL